MIRIAGDKARKVPGGISFFVSFPYDQSVVAAVKSLPLAVWHKKDAVWEIPEWVLPEALDRLTFLGEIELIPPDPGIRAIPEGVAPLTERELSDFKVRPFAHQIEGIDFMLRRRRCLLLDAPGLGKTTQAVYWADTLRKRGLIKHCLIICGINSLKSNWRREIRKFSDSDCLIIGERTKRNGEISPTPALMRERARQLREPIKEFFVVVNVESIRSEEIVEAILRSENEFGAMIFDELHKCSGTGSEQGRNLLKLKAEWMVGLTGTVITNDPLDCYLPLKWIGADSSTLTNFKASFCEFGGFGGHQIVGYKNLDFLRKELSSVSLRRTKDVAVGMPPKLISAELLDMEEDHARFYEAIKAGVKEEADKIELNSANLLALTTRLRQATADPAILTSNQVSATKLERCRELVEELVGQGEKVVVMSVFKEPIYKLGSTLAELRPLINTGDIADLAVSRNIERFQSDPEAKVFLATAAKCGTGITLNAASHMICLDIPWTDALFQQMTDRIHRLDNKSTAFVTVLACKGTIDQRVLDIVESKRQISDFVVDGKQNELARSLQSEMAKIIREL